MPAPALPLIPPDQFQGVANAIGDAFNFVQLDDVIYTAFREHKINDYAGSNQPAHEVASACLKGLEREGLHVAFLANILARVIQGSVVYVRITTALPAALQAIPDVARQLPGLLSGLAQTKAKLADPAAKAALHTSIGALEAVRRGITLLDCYKRLHDCLHNIQIRQFGALLASVRLIASDDAQLVYLIEYQDQVRAAIVSAQAVVAGLPVDDAQKSIESKWIDELDQAVQFYKKGLQDRVSAAAKIGVIKMSIVLRFQSPRLNDLIVAAAEGLPLELLRAALGKLAGDAGQFPAIAQAAEALAKIKDALRNRVKEHDQWQSVDKGIWYLDEVFGQSADPTEDFTGFWPQVRNPARTLADLDPAADWAKSLIEYSTRIDEEILRLDGARGGGAEPPRSALPGIFAGFRSEARHRFFAVDQFLKQDCGLLVAIGGPLDGILEELSHE